MRERERERKKKRSQRTRKTDVTFDGKLKSSKREKKRKFERLHPNMNVVVMGLKVLFP